jgi:hypothetical protein
MRTSPRMDPGVCLTEYWLKFAQFSKPKVDFFPAAAKKKENLPPDWGMRAGNFVATIQPRLGRPASRTLFRHAKRHAENSWWQSRLGFEVLVNRALDEIELTNPFLRFPRVRQQTRGNFSFQYLCCRRSNFLDWRGNFSRARHRPNGRRGCAVSF